MPGSIHRLGHFADISGQSDGFGLIQRLTRFPCKIDSRRQMWNGMAFYPCPEP
jgi:hypothetical protein